jgi:hypothetical protein
VYLNMDKNELAPGEIPDAGYPRPETCVGSALSDRDIYDVFLEYMDVGDLTWF